MEKALKEAIRIIGGPTAVGDILGVTSQAISQWRVCPAIRVLAMEGACDGHISRHDLRPDIFGNTPHPDQTRMASGDFKGVL